MAGLEFLSLIGTPLVAYLYRELDPNDPHFRASTTSAASVAFAAKSAAGAGTSSTTDGIFVFQYWPSQVQDSYEVEYATKMIPGGSHPLYQWVGGSGRTISFEAAFTAEVEDTDPIYSVTNVTPSGRYTVNVAGAISRLKSYQLPTYDVDGVDPPPKLRLVFPNSRAGGNVDDILCFLKSCRVTRESCFPSGIIRAATIALEFIEVVQHSSGANSSGSTVQFIDRTSFLSESYKFGGNNGVF